MHISITATGKSGITEKKPNEEGIVNFHENGSLTPDSLAKSLVDSLIQQGYENVSGTIKHDNGRTDDLVTGKKGE